MLSFISKIQFGEVSNKILQPKAIDKLLIYKNLNDVYTSHAISSCYEATLPYDNVNETRIANIRSCISKLVNTYLRDTCAYLQDL